MCEDKISTLLVDLDRIDDGTDTRVDLRDYFRNPGRINYGEAWFNTIEKILKYQQREEPRGERE